MSFTFSTVLHCAQEYFVNASPIALGLMYFVDLWTGLVDSRTELETALPINPGIIQLFQYWRHHYQATAAGTTLPCKL